MKLTEEKLKQMIIEELQKEGFFGDMAGQIANRAGRSIGRFMRGGIPKDPEKAYQKARQWVLWKLPKKVGFNVKFDNLINYIQEDWTDQQGGSAAEFSQEDAVKMIYKMIDDGALIPRSRSKRSTARDARNYRRGRPDLLFINQKGLDADSADPDIGQKKIYDPTKPPKGKDKFIVDQLIKMIQVWSLGKRDKGVLTRQQDDLLMKMKKPEGSWQWYKDWAQQLWSEKYQPEKRTFGRKMGSFFSGKGFREHKEGGFKLSTSQIKQMIKEELHHSNQKDSDIINSLSQNPDLMHPGDYAEELDRMGVPESEWDFYIFHAEKAKSADQPEPRSFMQKTGSFLKGTGFKEE